MADEKLYRVAPLRNDWISYDVLADELWNWATLNGYGPPAITISKREQDPDH